MRESQQNILIQPRKFANKQGEVRYHWKIEEFPRLKELLFSDEGQIDVLINGHVDHQDRMILTAQISGVVQLECQTSFTQIDYNIDNRVDYCAVYSEDEFKQVEGQYEPVMLDDGFIDIKQVIEDELILLVPIAANKPTEELEQKLSFGELDEAAIEAEKEASNPFRVLTNLKKD